MKEFLDSLTLGEVAYYEKTTGEPIGEVYDRGFIGDATLTLFYLLKKRDNSDLKVEDVQGVNALEAVAAIEAYTPKAKTE